MTTPTRLAVLAFFVANLYAAPCVKGTAECTEWVSLSTGSNPARSLIYRTYSLDETNPNITRALIVVHGASRDADNYFRTAVAAAFLAGAMDDTIVVSPRFASSDRSCKDKLDKNEVSWSCNGDSWRLGRQRHQQLETHFIRFCRRNPTQACEQGQLSQPQIRSGDRTLQLAVNSSRDIEMATKVYGKLGLPITFVVSNPSSYAYLDETRPGPDCQGLQAFSDGRNCTTYNSWPYGLRSTDRLHREDQRRPAEEAMAARPLIVPARRNRYPSAGRFRFVLSRHGARPHRGAPVVKPTRSTSMKSTMLTTPLPSCRYADTMGDACSPRKRLCRSLSEAVVVRRTPLRPGTAARANMAGPRNTELRNSMFSPSMYPRKFGSEVNATTFPRPSRCTTTNGL